MAGEGNTVLLSFDLEEFDTPLEYGYEIPFSEQLSVSQRGTETILSVLKKFDIHATFFSTVNFAESSRNVIYRLLNEGHELGSHGYYHSKFELADLLSSKTALEKMTTRKISGFRMPRMQPVNYSALADAGYKYDSSINPIYLPGRYNNLGQSRNLHQKEGVWELPAAATPIVRIPLFWLAFHHFPLWFYQLMTRAAHYPHRFVVIYFHPWEFTDLKGKFGLPPLLTKCSGSEMTDKLTKLLAWMLDKGYRFQTSEAFVAQKQSVLNGR